MKLKYLSIIIAGTVLSLFSSCNDFLDKVPDTRVELNTPEQLRLLLVTGYCDYNYGWPCEISTDNITDNNAPNYQGVRYNLPSYSRLDDEMYRWEDAKSGTGSDSPSGIWEGCYGSIAVANAVLEKVEEWEKQGDAMKEKLATIKGEALLIRAYHHFILTSVFCMPYRGEELSKNDVGIPYITKPETKVLVHYNRGTVAEDYAKIEADLLEGLPLVKDAQYEAPKFHFNRAAANAFAARFYLFKREYDKVVKYANDVFAGSAPETYMSDIWSQTNLYYLADFGRYYTNPSQNRNLMLMSTYSAFRRHFSGCRYACNRDAKRATIEGPGPTWENCQYRNSQTNEKFAMNPAFTGVCFVAGGQDYGTFFGGPIGEQFEYSDKIAGIGYAHVVRAEFTGEETLLCRAEAKLFLGDIDGCIADLKIWDDAHQKNSSTDDRMVPMTKELVYKFYSKTLGYGIVKPINIDLVCPSDKYSVTDAILPYLQCVQHLRRIETIHSGMRWFDIKRYGIEISHDFGKDNTYTLKVLDPRWAMQLPSEIISAGLVANERPVMPSGGNNSEKAIKYEKFKE